MNSKSRDRHWLLLISTALLALAADLMALLMINAGLFAPTLPQWPIVGVLCAAALLAAWALALAIARPAEREAHLTEHEARLTAREVSADSAPGGEGAGTDAREGKPGAVERLAGGVAHDLNNILLVVRGYADLALAEKDAAYEVRCHLQELMTGLRRASDLVGQLFAVARRSPTPLLPLDLNEAIHHALGQGSPLLSEHARVSFLPRAGLPPVRAAGDLIDRLVSSLLAFALETVPEGSAVTIGTNVEGVNAAQGGRVILHLFCPGPGISESERFHFFEPFHEFASGGRRRMGLELAAASGIAALLGGEIGLDSPPSGGSMFRIKLPAYAQDPPARPASRGCSVLLAEDDNSIRELAQRVLVREGYAVLAAGDGEEALRLFEENRDTIRAALLDDVMPKMGGRAVLQKIREWKPALPVIFFAGYNWSAEESPAGPGSEELLSKPYEPRELLRRVRRLLGGSG